MNPYARLAPGFTACSGLQLFGQEGQFAVAMKFDDYELGTFFDEVFDEARKPRALARSLVRNIAGLPTGELRNRQKAAERALLQRESRSTFMGSGPGRK